MAVSEGQRQGVLSIRLTPEQRERLDTLARSHGLKSSELARKWIIEKLDDGGGNKLLQTVSATRQDVKELRNGLAMVLAALLTQKRYGADEAVSMVNEVMYGGKRQLSVKVPE